MSKKSLTLSGAFIWSLVVLLILFWHLDLLDLLNPKKVRDLESAHHFVSIIRLNLIFSFVTILVSAAVIWLASFGRNLAKPLLIFEGILAILVLFSMIAARFSGCEGLECIGPSFVILFGSFILTFVALSAPFILHIRVYGDQQTVRKVSIVSLALLIALGSYLYFIYPNILLKAGAEKTSSDVSNYQQELGLLLFKPNYIPDGDYKKTEKILDYTGTYELFYSLGASDYIRIEQSKPQRKYEEYLERHLKRQGKGEPPDYYESEEFKIDESKAIVEKFVVYGAQSTAKLVLIKEGTEIEVLITGDRTKEESKGEAIKIAESLIPI